MRFLAVVSLRPGLLPGLLIFRFLGLVRNPPRQVVGGVQHAVTNLNEWRASAAIAVGPKGLLGPTEHLGDLLRPQVVCSGHGLSPQWTVNRDNVVGEVASAIPYVADLRR